MNAAPLRWLSRTLAGLAGAAAATGLLWRGDGPPTAFVTARGEHVALHGDGLYRFDSVFTAAGNRALDAVVLLLGVPLLLVALRAYRQGSPRGTLLLAGVFGYLLYIYATNALGTAYNPLFLVYVAALGTGLFGFVLATRAADPRVLSAAYGSARMPRRALAAFLFTGSAVTAFLWLEPLAWSLVTGRAPELLGPYTTLVTFALDLAVIAPATAVAGALVLRRQPAGLLLATPLLVLIVSLLPTIVLSTVLQLRVGVSFTAAEIAGPIAGFAVLGVLGTVLLVALLRAVPGPAAGTTQQYRGGPDGGSVVEAEIATGIEPRAGLVRDDSPTGDVFGHDLDPQGLLARSDGSDS